MKNIIITLALALAFSTIVSAQGTNGVTIGSSDVNENIGKAIYTFPLANFNELGINIPITLLNTTGAIKNNDKGLEVGVGWNLNHVPTINRIKRGKLADETVKPQYQGITEPIGNALEPFLGYLTYGYLVYSDYLADFPDANECELFDNVNYIDPCRIIKDLESDLFHFNYGSYSLNFYLLNGDIVFLDNSDIEIEYIITDEWVVRNDWIPNDNPFNLTYSRLFRHISGWKVTMPNGEILLIGDYNENNEFSNEYTSYTSEEFNFANNIFHYHYSSKWVAQTIMNEDNEVSFSYDKETIRNHRYKSGNYIFADYNGLIDIYNDDLQLVTHNNIYLKKIEGKYNVIELDYDHKYFSIGGPIGDGWWDVTYANLLSSIITYSKANDLKYCVSKKVLNYDEILFGPVESADNYKFILTSIDEGCSSSNTYTTDFQYYNGDKLQHCLSKGIDLWGYNNGKEDNESLLYLPSISNECLNLSSLADFENQNRAVDFEYAIAGSLKSIHYPNGKFIEFEYEPNSVYSIAPLQSGINSISGIISGEDEDCDESLFTLNSYEFNNNYEYSIEISSSLFCPDTQNDTNFGVPLPINVYKVIGGQQIHCGTFDSNLLAKKEIDNYIDIDYNVEVDYIFKSDGYHNINLTEIPLEPQNVTVGGSRLKSQTINEITTYYEYDKVEEDSNTSSEAYSSEFCEECDTKVDDGPSYCLNGSSTTVQNIAFNCGEEIEVDLWATLKSCSIENFSNLTIIIKDAITNYEVVSWNEKIYKSSFNKSLTFQDLQALGVDGDNIYTFIIKTDQFDENFMDASVSVKVIKDDALSCSTATCSSGILNFTPYNFSFVTNDANRIVNDNCEIGQLFSLNTNFYNPFLSILGPEVYYENIVSYTNKELNGYVLKEFEVKKDLIKSYQSINYLSPFLPFSKFNVLPNHMFFGKDFSLLSSITFYDKNEEEVFSEKYNYDIEYERNYLPYTEEFYNCNYEIQSSTKNCLIIGSKITLKQKLQTSDNISINQSYTYINSVYPNNITKFNVDFPSQALQSSTTYSFELDEYSWLTDLHYKVPIIQLNNNGLGGGVKYEYELIDDKVRMTKQYSLNTDLAEENQWVLSKEYLSWNEDGQATEIWSKGDSKNTSFIYENGLLISSAYGARVASYEYDDLRRLIRVTDPMGISVFTEEYDEFHRKKIVHNSVIGDALEGLSKTEYDYVISLTDDERVTSTLSVQNSTFNIPDQQSIAYFDNYGRGYKQENLAYTQNNNNYVTLSTYDEIGRASTNFSPSSGNSSSLNIYEKSPLSRILEYKPHGTSDRILYKYGDQVVNYSTFPSSYFIKSSITDENGNETRSYATIDGKIKIVVDALDYSTRYEYNDRNQLVKVTAPDGSIYSYSYDGFGRLIDKTIPNKGQYVYAYNNYEQVSSEILPNGEVLYYNYDAEYNSFLTSIRNSDQVDLQRYEPYHDNHITDLVGDEYIKILDENRELHHSYTYDIYGRTLTENREFYRGSSLYTYTYDNLSNVRTVSRAHTQDDGSILNFSTIYEYDKGIRLEEARANIHGIEEEVLVNRMKYNDSDWLVYKNQGGLHAELYDYTSRGWLSAINSIDNSYDVPIPNCNAILSDKCLISSELPTVPVPEYEENQPMSSLFSIEFNRNHNFELNAASQKNGNISWMEWRVQGEDTQQYGFTYDNIYRLREAKYKAVDKPNCDDKNVGAYNVSINGYDEVGNIGSIIRNGLLNDDLENPAYGQIDNILMTHEGGLLNYTTENGSLSKGYKSFNESTKEGEFTYENGNLVYDPIRGITDVEYNFLDLPTIVTTTNGTLSFKYDALGNQLSSTKEIGENTLSIFYADGIEYENDILKSYAFGEGRVVYNQPLDGISYTTYIEWAIADHLGNIRVRYVDKNKDGEITVDTEDVFVSEITGSYHYYPHGQLMEGEWNQQQGHKNRYQFNGIEHFDDIAGGLSFAAFRVHDPGIGRWLQVDPKAELGYNFTPFNCMWNNPIVFSDPYGDTPAHAGAAIIGAGFNLWSNWGNIDSFSEGLAYAANGALAGVVSLGNPVAAGAILAGGNKVIQAVNGDFTLDDLDSFNDLSGTVLDIGLDFMGGYGVGDMTRGIESLIKGEKFITKLIQEGRQVTQLITNKTSIGTAISGGSKVAVSLVDDVVKVGGNTASNGIGLSTTKLVGQGKNVVYQGIDAAGKVRYVGITSRAPGVRFAEHLNSLGTGKELLRYRVIDGATNLTRTQVRVLEQGLINKYGLSKNGGSLLNKINSIAPKHWWKYTIL